ncbi:MAG: AMP-binding protein [Actinomycetota bacterium]|nr:AMP-binding protein [Actinomycetota bacterium]
MTAALLVHLAPDAADRAELVSVAGRSLSTAALAEAAGAVAANLGGAGVVAVEAGASLETIVAVVGALAAGAVIVPVPVDSGPAERDHILTDSAAAVLLLTGESTSGDGPAGIVSAPVNLDQRASLSITARPPSAPALLLYTSGTTGPPKGVPISGPAITACLDGLADAWAVGDDDVVAHGLPLFHVHGLVLGLLGPLYWGGRMVHTGRATPANYARAVGHAGATMLFGVPTVWSRIAADGAAGAALRPARLLVSGSAALPGPVFEGLRTISGHAPVERYGMTETLITLSVRAEDHPRPGWVGTPLKGVQARLRGEDGRAVAADGESIGDLEVRGPTVMAGYWNQPADAESPFTVDGWFRTGDVATVDGHGYHRLLGRRSTDLVKSGGYRIGTGEVEATLLAHPRVTEAAVVGAPDPDLGAVLVAFVVADGVTSGELIEFVAGELAVHKRPRRVELVNALPRNAMGKVNKTELVDP